MTRSIHILFLLHFLFAAADPWMVIHTCAGETDVEMMSASADDPCACMEGANAAPCCTVEFRSFQLDAARPAVITAPVSAPVDLIPPSPDLACAPVVALHLPVCTAVHPPGTSLSILHCVLLV